VLRLFGVAAFSKAYLFLFAWALLASPVRMKAANHACDYWQPISAVGSPQNNQIPVVAVWDGSEMVVWSNPKPGHGGTYNPATNSWGTVSTLDAPGEFYTDAAVWTGSQMIVWGSAYADPVHLEAGYVPQGGRYNPSTDTWQPMSEENAPLLMHPAIAWTGSEMLVWGGWDGTGDTSLGAAYDPDSDTWRPISAQGAPRARAGQSGIWTGSQMIIWGGKAGPFADLGDGAAYDPSTDTWTSLSNAGGPSARFGHIGVWTGFRMFIYGGLESDHGYSQVAAEGGGLYDPASDSWSDVSTTDAPTGASSRVGPPGVPVPNTAVWDGHDILVWNGAHLFLYDPAVDAWTQASTASEPSPRDLNVPIVWSGSEALMWGGGLNASHAAQYPVDGAAYVPCAADG
jgi:hypothetical protein